MKSRAAMFSAATASVARSTSVTSYINLNGHDSRGANSGKVDASTASSSEQFVAKQDFVFAFYVSKKNFRETFRFRVKNLISLRKGF